MSNSIRYAARADDLSQQEPAKTETAQAWSQSVAAVYETDPELIAAVLPKPLEPGAQPLVRASISSVKMGSLEFGAAWFGVEARHEGTDGAYALLMPMSSEQAVIGGREMYGEPKKLADVTVNRDGDNISGAVTRGGVTIWEINGKVTETLEAGSENKLDFYFQFLLSPDGKGFTDEPTLVYCHKEATLRSKEAVDGELILRESRLDPIADLPVRKLVRITASERQTTQRGEIVSRVPSEWLIPFAHQRYDNFNRSLTTEASLPTA